ncbi:hypothetical protein ACIPRD_00445 [Streptomyces sp. NPDC090108]|uniref:hypothetical protein n=1 Tax=Streptomyces sp. NPDC090108 TaxID=3365947 RepID=UPI0037FF3F68
MLALRLTRAARPAVQLRRLLVAAASAGTGFLLLGALGYALGHPEQPGAAALRLVWCVVPLAATVYFALAVARTDPGTRPRPGLSAIGLGPGRLMAISALTTALACLLGSTLALLFFLHLRGDLSGMPFDGAAAQFLAAGRPLPVPAALTLLGLVPAIASATVALALRPRDPRAAGARETSAAHGGFGARLRTAAGRLAAAPAGPAEAGPVRRTEPELVRQQAGAAQGPDAGAPAGAAAEAVLPDAAPGAPEVRAIADDAAPGAALSSDAEGAGTGDAGAEWSRALPEPAPPRAAPAGLPWGITLIAAGLAVQTYAGRTRPALSLTALPAEPVAVLGGWILTALGLVLAAPGLTHLCGRLLQSAQPGALRLLAGRVLMAEATRVGRPLGIVCAVAAAACAMTAVPDASAPAFGPLTALGSSVVAGCTLATLLTAAVEARQSRAGTTAALLRLGAPASMLRGAAALRAAALLALFVPLTLLIANLAVLAR